MKRFWVPIAVVVVALMARVFRDADPRRLDLSRELARPSTHHPLGCGDGGVDLLSLTAEALLRSMALAAKWISRPK